LWRCELIEAKVPVKVPASGLQPIAGSLLPNFPLLFSHSRAYSGFAIGVSEEAALDAGVPQKTLAP
jgi:hypothetical protein